MFIGTLKWVLTSGGLIAVLFLYPSIIIPLYRSNLLSDGMRLVFVCFIHPVFAEVRLIYT